MTNEQKGQRKHRGRSGREQGQHEGGIRDQDRAFFPGVLEMMVATLSTQRFFYLFQHLNHGDPSLTRHRGRTIVRAVFRGVDFERSAHPFWGVSHGR